MYKRILIGIHIVVTTFSVIIGMLASLDCFEYIYAISLCQLTNYSFDTIIFATLISIIIIIIDISGILISIIRGVLKYMREKHDIGIKRLIFWSAMLSLAIISLYMFLDNYVMYIS